MLSHLWSKCRI